MSGLALASGAGPQMAQMSAIYADGSRALRAISAEIADYNDRMLADGTETLKELTASSSPSEAMSVLAAYSKRSMQEFAEQANRLSSLYVEVAEAQMRAFQALLTGAKL
jgi:hypothetical protein